MPSAICLFCAVTTNAFSSKALLFIPRSKAKTAFDFRGIKRTLRASELDSKIRLQLVVNMTSGGIKPATIDILTNAKGVNMATMTIRYDDELEKMIEELCGQYHVNTKNKAIVTVIEKHMELVRSNYELKLKIESLEANLKYIKKAVREKLRADNAINQLDLN